MKFKIKKYLIIFQKYDIIKYINNLKKLKCMENIKIDVLEDEFESELKLSLSSLNNKIVNKLKE